MSVDYYQRIVNGLDKEIADLEKKQASADKKAADEQKKAASVTISKNASASTIKSKMNQIARYNDASNKATSESADLAKKIADIGNQQKSPILQVQGWGFSCIFIGNGAIIKVKQNMICLTKYCWIAKLTCGY